MLITFIILGSLIIMNVIVSLFVNQLSTAKTEIILAEQRIGEITALNGSICKNQNSKDGNGK